jgi:hypothetical protein
MRRGFGLIGVIVMACVLGTGSATAAEAPEPPLAFADVETLQTTCAKLAAGVNVRIRNETAARQRVHLIPLEFKSGDTAIGSGGVCGGLRIKVPPRLRGGRVATATLRATKKRKGEFSGSLLLFATKGRVARREVSIAAKNPSKTLAATPLVESAAAALNDSDRGSIWVPVEGPASALPRPPAGAALSVGAVTGANGSAAVVYGGRKRLNGSTAKIKLELDNGLEPGAYSGKIDLNPSDEEKGSVALEIKVAACWAIAALLLLVGIVAALLLQRLIKRLLPRARLRGRIQGLSKRHKEAMDALIAPPGGSKDWSRFRIENLESLRKSLDEQLRTATKSVVIEIDKKVLESLESAIATVEAQIDLLKEIPDHAGDLEDEIQKLEASPEGMPRPPGANGDKPALVILAREALAGGPAKAGRLKLRVEEIDARAKQMRILCELEERLADLSADRKTLKALNNPEVAKLDSKLTAIRYLLWTAATADDLETAASEIQETAKTIAELWHELHQKVPSPSKAAGLASGSRPLLATYAAIDWQPELLSEETAVVETLEVPPGAPSAPPAPRAIPEPPPEAPLDAESIEQEVRRAFWAQWLAFVIAALVALATGLLALYVPNETWGSEWDYLAAAIWGLGVQATVSTVATSLDSLGGLGLLRRG